MLTDCNSAENKVRLVNNKDLYSVDTEVCSIVLHNVANMQKTANKS